MRRANQLVGKTLGELAKHIKPGVTTLQLDKIAEEFIRDNGAVPTFKNFPNPYGGPFPASICTSVNDAVVHGIPDQTELRDGDIISIDCGTLLDGFNGDSAYTFCVGEVSEEVKKTAEDYQGESLSWNPSSRSRKSSGRYRQCCTRPLRGRRLWNRARTYRSWYRQRNA